MSPSLGGGCPPAPPLATALELLIKNIKYSLIQLLSRIKFTIIKFTISIIKSDNLKKS